MKHSLPLMALLAASTLAAPLMAQDISSFSSLRALATEISLSNRAVIANAPVGAIHAPLGYSVNAPRIVTPNIAAIAALTPDVSVLAPRRSIAPVPRRTIARIVTPTHAAPMADVMAEARAAAPLGANIAVVSGTNTAVITGANTAVIHSSPDVTSSPRLTLWQRVFGL